MGSRPYYMHIIVFVAQRIYFMQCQQGIWKWLKPPPASRKQADSRNLGDGKGTKKGRHQKQTKTIRERLLKGMVFSKILSDRHAFHPHLLWGFIYIEHREMRIEVGKSYIVDKILESENQLTIKPKHLRWIKYS